MITPAEIDAAVLAATVALFVFYLWAVGCLLKAADRDSSPAPCAAAPRPATVTRKTVASAPPAAITEPAPLPLYSWDTGQFPAILEAVAA